MRWLKLRSDDGLPTVDPAEEAADRREMVDRLRRADRAADEGAQTIREANALVAALWHARDQIGAIDDEARR